jgi:glucose/arabinose dehydrogenase
VNIMSRTSTCLKAVALCLLAHASVAGAQQQQQQQPPSDKPPKLERIEPGSDVPATTIPPRPRTQITEHKSNSGQVTEVEVQSAGSHYYMRPNKPAGNAQPGDAESGAVRAPEWKVLEFDLTRKRKAATPGAEGTPAPAPAPPAEPAKK